MVLILLPAGVALSIAPLCDDIVAQEYVCVSPNLLAQRILFCMFIFFSFQIICICFRFSFLLLQIKVWLNKIVLKYRTWNSILKG